MTAFRKDGDADPVLVSIFPNDVQEEAHGVLIKFDKASDLLSRVNLGLETCQGNRNNNSNNNNNEKYSLQRCKWISKQEEGHIEEISNGKAILVFFPQRGLGASLTP